MTADTKKTKSKARRATLVPVRPPVLAEADAAAYVGKSQSWMRQRRFRDIARVRLGKAPDGPAWIQIESSILYRVADLDTWLESKTVERGQVEFRGRAARARVIESGAAGAPGAQP
jgi:hypothetical protein